MSAGCKHGTMLQSGHYRKNKLWGRRLRKSDNKRQCSGLGHTSNTCALLPLIVFRPFRAALFHKLSGFQPQLIYKHQSFLLRDWELRQQVYPPPAAPYKGAFPGTEQSISGGGWSLARKAESHSSCHCWGYPQPNWVSLTFQMSWQLHRPLAPTRGTSMEERERETILAMNMSAVDSSLMGATGWMFTDLTLVFNLLVKPLKGTPDIYPIAKFNMKLQAAGIELFRLYCKQ